MPYKRDTKKQEMMRQLEQDIGMVHTMKEDDGFVKKRFTFGSIR